MGRTRESPSGRAATPPAVVAGPALILIFVLVLLGVLITVPVAGALQGVADVLGVL
jgi:hypothetical protein